MTWISMKMKLKMPIEDCGFVAHQLQASCIFCESDRGSVQLPWYRKRNAGAHLQGSSSSPFLPFMQLGKWVWVCS
jgi:hypothetical protein